MTARDEAQDQHDSAEGSVAPQADLDDYPIGNVASPSRTRVL